MVQDVLQERCTEFGIFAEKFKRTYYKNYKSEGLTEIGACEKPSEVNLDIYKN